MYVASDLGVILPSPVVGIVGVGRITLRLPATYINHVVDHRGRLRRNMQGESGECFNTRHCGLPRLPRLAQATLETVFHSPTRPAGSQSERARRFKPLNWRRCVPWSPRPTCTQTPTKEMINCLDMLEKDVMPRMDKFVGHGKGLWETPDFDTEALTR